jgi:hypothetical protein
MQVLGDHGDGVAGGERQLAGRQFIQHDAQRVQIGPAVEFLPERQLGCQLEHDARRYYPFPLWLAKRTAL